MFNVYAITQNAKLRQGEVERKAKDAWKYYEHPLEAVEIPPQTNTTFDSSCQCCCT